MSKTFRPYAPRQAFLLPPSPLEWLPEGHLALFLLDLIPQLDLSAIYAHYDESCAAKGYTPRWTPQIRPWMDRSKPATRRASETGDIYPAATS